MNRRLISVAPRCESCGQHIRTVTPTANHLSSSPLFLPRPSATPPITIGNLPSDSDSSDSDYEPSSSDFEDLSGDEHVLNCPFPLTETRLRGSNMDQKVTAGPASPALTRAESDQDPTDIGKDLQAMETKQPGRRDEDREKDTTEITDGPSKIEDTGDIDDMDLEGSEDGLKAEATADQSVDEDDVSVDENGSLCQYTANCNTGSRDYRKVISHIFGRNKKCTTQIPDSCWIVYCRKHYQRTRYRTSKAEVKTYFNIQFDNLARQLTRMERWGGVRSWTIALRKKERDLLDNEDRKLAKMQASGATVDQATVTRTHQCRERFLLPCLGEDQTFADVRRLITAIQREVENTSATELPGFELLPDIDPQLYPPIGLRKTEDKPSPLTSSRKRPIAQTSAQPSKRRLVKGSDIQRTGEDTKASEDEGMSDSETHEDVQPSPSKELKKVKTESRQPANKAAKKTNKAPRTTAEVLETGWFAEDKRLKAPPRRSATPDTPKVKPAVIRKEASHHSTTTRKPLEGLAKEKSGELSAYAAISQAQNEENEPKDHWASLGRYDPWPYSNDKEGSGKSADIGSSIRQTGFTKPSTPMKEGAKQPTTPTTPDQVFPSIEGGTKKRRVAQIPSKMTYQRQTAVTSSPENVAYRPATPKTPPHGSPSPAARLPEMRKFPTPQKSRTATPNKHASTPQSGRKSGPQFGHALNPRLDHTPTKGGMNTTSEAYRQSSTASPRQAISDHREDATGVDRNAFAAKSPKNTQKDDIKMETS